MGERKYQDHQYVMTNTGDLVQIEHGAQEGGDGDWWYDVTFTKKDGKNWVSQVFGEDELNVYIPPQDKRSHLMRR